MLCTTHNKVPQSTSTTVGVVILKFYCIAVVFSGVEIPINSGSEQIEQAVSSYVVGGFGASQNLMTPRHQILGLSDP